MPKLSDAQAVLLTTAAARADLSVLPTPETLRLKGAALERTLTALLGRGLIAEVPAPEPAAMSPVAGLDAAPKRLIVMPAGLEALGLESPGSTEDANGAALGQLAPSKTEPAPPRGKLGLLLDAVSRPDGATLDELTAALHWQPHTVRAAITRLRQRGYDVRIATMGTRNAYRLVPRS
jgi:hypothetical protein